MQLTPRELHLAELDRKYHQTGATNEIPMEKPVSPSPGDHWYDSRAKCLCIWDGRQWVEAPQD